MYKFYYSVLLDWVEANIPGHPFRIARYENCDDTVTKIDPSTLSASEPTTPEGIASSQGGSGAALVRSEVPDDYRERGIPQ